MSTTPKNSDWQADRFARIQPIVGDTLFKKRVAIIGRRGTARLIEYLACCGIGRFDLVTTAEDDRSSDSECAFNMLAQLRSRLQLDIISTVSDLASCQQILVNNEISLFIGTGRRAEFELLRTMVDRSGQPGIFFRATAANQGLIFFLLPGESWQLPQWADDNRTAGDLFGQLHLANVVANFAKGLLLAGSPFQRADIIDVIDHGVRAIMVGHPSWPWAIVPLELSQQMPVALQTGNNSMPEFDNLKTRRCMIIGLGSLGSVAAEILGRLGADLLLIDGEEVAAANPIRQIYRFDQIGESKANACAALITGNGAGNGDEKIVAHQAEITSDEESLAKLSDLIKEHHPEVAIVATGTTNDRAISQLLRNEKIPHVVVSCYARARFFEAIVVDNNGGPCFGCLRGHLHLGASPSLSPEQRARYVSNDHDLAAEPATRIETGRAADLAAQIAYAMLQPHSNPWLLRAIDEDQTFFLGGNVVERQGESSFVYGIELPSQVRLYGLQDIEGRGQYLQCWDCGRKLPISIHHETNFQ